MLLDPRLSSQSRKNKAPQGINVERSQREIRRGAGSDAVQEETGELGEAATFSSTARWVTLRGPELVARPSRQAGARYGNG